MRRTRSRAVLRTASRTVRRMVERLLRRLLERLVGRSARWTGGRMSGRSPHGSRTWRRRDRRSRSAFRPAERLGDSTLASAAAAGIQRSHRPAGPARVSGPAGTCGAGGSYGPPGRPVWPKYGGTAGRHAWHCVLLARSGGPGRPGAPVDGGFEAAGAEIAPPQGSRDVSLEEPFGFLRGGPVPSAPGPDPATGRPSENSGGRTARRPGSVRERGRRIAPISTMDLAPEFGSANRQGAAFPRRMGDSGSARGTRWEPTRHWYGGS